MHVFYLHGFASSARSSKASFFAARLAPLGGTLLTPDFNEPDFSTLTVTRMLDQLDKGLADLPAGPVALIGSSLGAFVAVQSAVRNPERIDRLVLLAPALDFGANRMRDLGEEGLLEWQRTDRLDVFHHAYGRVIPVRYELFADARRYDSLNATLSCPALVFQGTRDASVDPEMVRRWAASRPQVDLHMLDDDHQLLASLEQIWIATEPFLRL